MKYKRWMLWLLVAALVSSLPVLAGSSFKEKQSFAIADLIHAFLNCTVSPCLDSDFDDSVGNDSVADDYYAYSDITRIYPHVEGQLQGVVQWEDGTGAIRDLTMILTGVRASHKQIMKTIELTFSDCQFELTDEELNGWECTTLVFEEDRAGSESDGSEDEDEAPKGEEFFIEIYFGSGIIQIEVY